jgi:WD40 repeat protein
MALFLIVQVASISWAANFEPIAVSFSSGKRHKISPDGSLVAIWENEKIRVFEIATGLLRFEIVKPVESLLFSPDGRLLVVNYSILDTSAGNIIYDLPGKAILCFSPNSQLMAVRESKGLTILEAATGSIHISLPIDLAPNIDCSISADNSLLAVKSHDITQVWNLEEIKLIHTFDNSSVSFSPQGDLFLTYALKENFSEINVFKVKNKSINHLISTGGIRGACSFTQDGTSIISKNEECLHVTEAYTHNSTGQKYNKRAFSADRLLSLKKYPTQSTIRRRGEKKSLFTLQGYTFNDLTVFSAVFGRNGKVLTTSTHSIKHIWDIETGNFTLVDKIDSNFIKTNIYYIHSDKKIDGVRIEIVDDDKTLKILDDKTGALLQKLDCFGEKIEFVSFNESASRFVIASKNHFKIIDRASKSEILTSFDRNRKGDFKEWERDDNGKLIIPLRPVFYANETVKNAGIKIISHIEGARLSYDGSKLILFFGQYIEAWDIATKTELYSIKTKDLKPNFLYNVETGTPISHEKIYPNLFLYVDSEQALRFLSLEKETLINRLSESCKEIFLNPDRTRVLSICSDSIAKLWDIQTEDLLYSLPRKIMHISLSTDWSRLVTIDSKRTAEIWDVKTGEVIYSLPGQFREISFSPDGSYLLTLDEDWAAKIWNAATGAEIRTLGIKNNRWVFEETSFKAHGHLFKGIYEDILRVWILPPEEMLNHAEQNLNQMIYLKLLNLYLQKSHENARSYDDFVAFLAQAGSVQENASFTSLKKESQQYIRALLPGRP